MNGYLTKTRDLTDVPVSASTMVPSAQYSYEAQPGSILDYWGIICRRKGTVALLAGIGLAIALGVTLPQRPVYQAKATLEVQELNQDFMNMKSVNPIADPSAVNALTDMQTQIKILQSESLLERTLSKMKAASPNAGDIKPSPVPAWQSMLQLGQPAQDSADPVAAIAKDLKVNLSGQTRIIEILFDSTDPKFAAGFANTLASEFIDENIQARWQMSQHTSEWLVRQLDDLRVRLRNSEDALQAYARQKGLIFSGENNQNVADEKLRQLQTELLRAQADRVSRESRFETTRSSSAETLPDVLNDSNLRGLQTSLTELRRREAELAATFKPDYSKVKKTRAEIAALETAIQQERAAIVSRIDNEFQEAARREKMLASAYANQTRVVTEDSEKAIQYNILKREVDTNHQVYESMLQRVKESTIASAMRASNVRILDVAKVPAQPYKPALPINIAMGLLGGSMLGIVFVVARARTNSSLQEPGDAGLLLGIPELGVIPSAAMVKKLSARVPSLFPAETQSSGVILAQGYSSPVADGFRAVLTSLMYSSGSERRLALVITSASPNEGKTTTATNLALALANINRRVLLIDGDIRNPHIHGIFGLDNSTGLTDVLNRTGIDDTAVEQFIRPTAFANLHVLTSGSGSEGADLLFSSCMPRLIARLRNQFDMIIIDTPPMLSMPDARVLGRMSDGVVLIARAGRTTRTAIQAAVQRFRQDYTPVLGIVLNDWNAKSSPYNAYYGNYPAASPERNVKVMPAAS